VDWLVEQHQGGPRGRMRLSAVGPRGCVCLHGDQACRSKRADTKHERESLRRVPFRMVGNERMEWGANPWLGPLGAYLLTTG